MDVVTKYKGSKLTKEDVDIMSFPCYLSDSIISFYFEHLSSTTEADDVLFIPPSISEVIAYEDFDNVKSYIEPLGFATKNLIFFAVCDCEHWSLLVFDRKLNEFLHHDSMEGRNNVKATQLYNALKDFVVLENLPASKHKKKNKYKTKSAAGPSVTAPPSFKECTTPQQTNGYDCGLFVLYIAREICEWHCTKKKSKVKYWFEERQVDASYVENKMRSDVKDLIITDISLGDS